MSEPIPEHRSLTSQEESLVRWLLEHGDARAVEYVPQVERAKVVSRCPCGCASVNFAIDNVTLASTGMDILADYGWCDADGARFGVFAFARADLLAGLEVWSIDGLKDPPRMLPEIEQLQTLPLVCSAV